MSKDETYVRNVTEIPNRKDAKYGWVVTGNDLWKHPPLWLDDEQKAQRPQDTPEAYLARLQTCGKISGFVMDRLHERYGFGVDQNTSQILLNDKGQPFRAYSNYLWRAKFFTPHAEKDSAKIKHCIADVNGMFMHGPMSTSPCGRGFANCQSDHRISKCWNPTSNGDMDMQSHKGFDWGKKGIDCAISNVLCRNCVKERLHDPLWSQQAAVQCHYAHGLTMDQMKEHNRIYETTILPDPCPGAAGYKPTPAPKSNDGAWGDPI
ncbi:hypothetical protein LTR95_010072 [Oleoguttula sp. CCFEE 5521]